MKQISTGAGLVALSVGMVATAFIATHRGSGEAFAQGGTSSPVVVGFGVSGNAAEWRYHRLFSDGTVQASAPVSAECGDTNSPPFINDRGCNGQPNPAWQTVPLPPTGQPFLSDVDASREVDGGDIAAVLLDWGTQGEQGPPMQIECTVNQVK